MLDVLFLAYNRLEFTRFTFEKLLKNTDWSLVNRLIVYDDSSEDGTAEFLEDALAISPVEPHFISHQLGSPVAVMKSYLADYDSELFCKVDNDLAVSPGWLEAMLGVMERHPDLELLGMEPSFMMPPPADWNGVYTYTPWKHIGGNGLMKKSYFDRTPPMDVDGFHGFSGHQWRNKPVKGFITPDLLACLLDRCPIEPWLSLSAEYTEKRWQRPWGKISIDYPFYFDWLTEGAVV